MSQCSGTFSTVELATWDCLSRRRAPGRCCVAGATSAPSERTIELVSEHTPDPDELDDELEQLSSEVLRVETIGPETGERRVEGLISRGDLARSIVERDESRPTS